jgi:hypothetical protein
MLATPLITKSGITYAVLATPLITKSGITYAAHNTMHALGITTPTPIRTCHRGRQVRMCACLLASSIAPSDGGVSQVPTRPGLLHQRQKGNTPHWGSRHAGRRWCACPRSDSDRRSRWADGRHIINPRSGPRSCRSSTASPALCWI